MPTAETSAAGGDVSAIASMNGAKTTAMQVMTASIFARMM
jgi:hypothetical protein